MDVLARKFPEPLQLLYGTNTVQNQRVRLDFYLRQPRLPLVTNGGLVVIGTDRYHILQRASGHWSPLIQIATDVGSRWEKFRIPTLKLFLNFGPGFFRLVPANTNTIIRRRIKQAQPSAGRNSNSPCGTRGKIGHQINRCVIF